MNWPPEYQVKTSTRARHVSFRITNKDGLVVTVPQRFNQAKIPSILLEKRRWILKHLHHVEKIQAERANVTRPDQINITAFAEVWQILYIPNNNKATRLRELENNVLIVSGDNLTDDACFASLKRWLKQKAKQYLLMQLSTLASEMQCDFTALSIRNQQTRWGSCSASKKISLNYKLILLPTELMRYVLIHELAHTKHLNHSQCFWQFVQQYDNNFKTHDKQLQHAEGLLPSWVVI